MTIKLDQRGIEYTSLSGLNTGPVLSILIHVNQTNVYDEYRLQFTKIYPRVRGWGCYQLVELELYGHEEGDSSLDTTLKSVYNVPGTQLEVYYDAKDSRAAVPELLVQPFRKYETR